VIVLTACDDGADVAGDALQSVFVFFAATLPQAGRLIMIFDAWKSILHEEFDGS
jgi:hypothetical protein